MGFDGGGEEPEGVAAPLAASLDHRQHGLDEAAAGGALRPRRELPPNHRVTQGTLARVVRRFHPFVPQERPQPLAMLVQLPARAAHVRIGALGAARAASGLPSGAPVPSDAARPPTKSSRPDHRPNARTTPARKCLRGVNGYLGRHSKGRRGQAGRTVFEKRQGADAQTARRYRGHVCDIGGRGGSGSRLRHRSRHGRASGRGANGGDSRIATKWQPRRRQRSVPRRPVTALAAPTAPACPGKGLPPSRGWPALVS